VSFKTLLNFEPHAFENAAIYLKSVTNFVCSNDCAMPLPRLVKLGLRIPENLSVKVVVVVIVVWSFIHSA